MSSCGSCSSSCGSSSYFGLLPLPPSRCPRHHWRSNRWDSLLGYSWYCPTEDVDSWAASTGTQDVSGTRNSARDGVDQTVARPVMSSTTRNLCWVAGSWAEVCLSRADGKDFGAIMGGAGRLTPCSRVLTSSLLVTILNQVLNVDSLMNGRDRPVSFNMPSMYSSLDWMLLYAQIMSFQREIYLK